MALSGLGHGVRDGRWVGASGFALPRQLLLPTDSSLLQDNVAFVLCLDTVGRGDSLHLHVSKPPREGTLQHAFLRELETVGAPGARGPSGQCQARARFTDGPPRPWGATAHPGGAGQAGASAPLPLVSEWSSSLGNQTRCSAHLGP